uniref:Uncharacterized protein n=1 Tax=Romanomermis culicivorax TaxID=13658 RepID=A0A915KZ80_ROMCU
MKLINLLLFANFVILMPCQLPPCHRPGHKAFIFFIDSYDKPKMCIKKDLKTLVAKCCQDLDEGNQEWVPEFVLYAPISNTHAYPTNYLIRVLKPNEAYPKIKEPLFLNLTS